MGRIYPFVKLNISQDQEWITVTGMDMELVLKKGVEIKYLNYLSGPLSELSAGVLDSICPNLQPASLEDLFHCTRPKKDILRLKYNFLKIYSPSLKNEKRNS